MMNNAITVHHSANKPRLRTLLTAVGAGLLSLSLTLPASVQAATSSATDKPYKALLNVIAGPTSFFLLADEKGYYRQQGIALEFTPSEGASVVIPMVKPHGFDIGYGDMSTLIEQIARSEEGKGPIAVFTTFNEVPFTIAVKADGPITSVKQLEGKRIWGHEADSAMRTFDLYAQAAGIDADQTRVFTTDDPMGSQAARIVAGDQKIDAMFGFVNTIIATSTPYGVKREQLRFFNYMDLLPDMYGNTLFVTRDMYQQAPDAVRALVQATNQGLRDTVADPNAAVDVLVKRYPESDHTINRTRLVGTLKMEMSHPEGAKLGIGAVDEARLQRLINAIVKAKNLPRTPTAKEVFDPQFLPPVAQRVTNLANSR
ncbi:ABC transporter substrate-binding protein [Aeromonas cavernicola]|nr:ABC transporter substrate-binding protein [Aeromonas cavernicola]